MDETSSVPSAFGKPSTVLHSQIQAPTGNWQVPPTIPPSAGIKPHAVTISSLLHIPPPSNPVPGDLSPHSGTNAPTTFSPLSISSLLNHTHEESTADSILDLPPVLAVARKSAHKPVPKRIHEYESDTLAGKSKVQLDEATFLENSESWKFLCQYFGQPPCFSALLTLVKHITSVEQIHFASTRSLRKIDLVKWLDYNWATARLFLEHHSPEDKNRLKVFLKIGT